MKNQNKHKNIIYKNADDFMPYIFDFIKDYLIKDTCYINRLDKVLDTKLSQIPFKERKEKLSFMIQSESKAVLCLYFTYTYLADLYKHSGRIEYKLEETKIPLIENEFKDIKTFENDLIEILSNLIKDKLNEVIQISLETHNMERIKELIRLLSI